MADNGDDHFEEELQRRVKKARSLWELEAEFDRDLMARSFAAQRRMLDSELETLQQELAETRGRSREFQFQLEDMQFQLAGLGPREDEEEDGQEDLVQRFVEYLRGEMEKCEQAGRPRWYYPTMIRCLPRDLQGLSQTSFASGIVAMKDEVKLAAKEKRKRKDCCDS